MTVTVQTILDAMGTKYVPGNTTSEKINYIKNTLSLPNGRDYINPPPTFGPPSSCGLMPVGKSHIIESLREEYVFAGEDDVIRRFALNVLSNVYQNVQLTKDDIYSFMRSRGFVGSDSDLKIIINKTLNG